MLHHGRGLPASPPVRYILKWEGWIFFIPPITL